MRPRARWGPLGLWRLCGVAVLGVGLGCGGPEVDRVAWACASDAQCGAGMLCRAGVCVAGDGALADARLCVTRVGRASGRDVRFSLLEPGVLEVRVDGRSTRVALPDGVAALDERPIDTCCESPCCAAPAATRRSNR